MYRSGLIVLNWNISRISGEGCSVASVDIYTLILPQAERESQKRHALFGAGARRPARPVSTRRQGGKFPLSNLLFPSATYAAQFK